MARIVVVGSVAQDDVLTLRQPLRAGRHLDAASRELRLGGGGANTAIPLRHAGHDVALVAPIGGDAVADWLLARLQADPWAEGRAIAGEGLRLVVVTRGPRGAEAFGASERVAVAAPVVAVVDSTAAGDVFAAGLLHALVLGQPDREALETAVAWGAATVACAGVPSRETIEGLL